MSSAVLSLKHLLYTKNNVSIIIIVDKKIQTTQQKSLARGITHVERFETRSLRP